MFASEILSRSFRVSMNSLASGGTLSPAAGVVFVRGVGGGSVPVASRWINSETERGFVRGIPGALSTIRGNDSNCGAQDCDGNGGGGIEVGGEVDQPVLSDAEDDLRTPSGKVFEIGPSDRVGCGWWALWSIA